MIAFPPERIKKLGGGKKKKKKKKGEKVDREKVAAGVTCEPRRC